MIAFPAIPTWAIPRPRDVAVALMVAGLCLPLGYCQGQSAGKAKVEAAAAVATVEVMKTDGSAKEVAAVERVNDIAEIAKLKEDLTDAVANLPDETPSVRRVSLACARLRAQGQDTAALPACGRPQGPAKAGATP